ncbi:MAG: DUF3880 domain-containing protein, partial [Gemmatimonadetes bacterium]|nr:DUF3880 domain-containing protein [Gemmatimonadota bacterium]
MDVCRVAVIFDNTRRPETTGVYCRRALEGLCRVEHVLPEDLPRMQSAAFDLFLLVDDGLDYAIRADLRPLAYWAIDTHLDFERALRRAAECDAVFCAQRNGAERLRGQGIATASWLPLACDATVHRPHDVPKRYDVCFVGHEL